MKKQNIVIIGVVALILAVAVGYALFSETITINGTATAKGDFDVEFTSVGTITKSGYTEVNDANGNGTESNIAVISPDKNTLTVTVNKLAYPGAYVTIPVTITNKGSIPAVLENIVQTGLDSEAGPIKVSYTGIAASETPIASGATQNMTIKVEWLENVNTTAEAASFTIKLKYKQVTAQ